MQYIFLAIIFILLADLQPAHAYLDPGSGSFILQMILGVVLGSLVALKVFFRRIKAFFFARFSRSKEKEKTE
ncbi:MAG: hypothetical protein WCV86_02620 [Patescibacteria group bacterium]|jgi:hypothetical protein